MKPYENFKLNHDSYLGASGDYLIFSIEKISIKYKQKLLILDKLPYLKSLSDGSIYLTTPATVIIEDYCKDSKDKIKINQLYKFERKRFNDFYNLKFKYSTAEHFFTPGLIVESPSSGYFTPVYFCQDVLLKFKYSKNFYFQEKSPSHFSIGVNDNLLLEGGINSDGNVIFWLGDLSKLPEQYAKFLIPENISSNHNIYSDFYFNFFNKKDYYRKRLDELKAQGLL